MSRHLRNVHDHINKEERWLIISKKTLRYGGKLHCPIKGCPKGKSYVRLDKHLINKHGKHPGKKLNKLMRMAKKKAFNESLQIITQRQAEPPAPEPPSAAPAASSLEFLMSEM